VRNTFLYCEEITDADNKISDTAEIKTGRVLSIKTDMDGRVTLIVPKKDLYLFKTPNRPVFES
jgi:hypothetical protein